MVLIFTKLKREFTLEWCSGETILSVLLSDFRFSALYKEVSPSAGQTQGLLSSAGAQRQTEPAHKSSPPWLTGSVKYI